MRIMWVVNLMIGALATHHGCNMTSGQWLNAEIEKEKDANTNQLIICTSGAVSETYDDANIRYIVLPHGFVSTYQLTEEHLRDWVDLISAEQPDLILIWGTEYAIGRCVLMANEKKLPTAIYVQGVMSAIAENYRGGLSDQEIWKFTTLLERFRHRTIFDIEAKHRNSAINEIEAVSLADSLILENDWAEVQYRKIAPNISIYRSRLPIQKSFSSYQWQEGQYTPHTIITTAAAYPLKGLHVLLRAIERVKKQYPDVHMLVPGVNEVFVKGFRKKLRQSGYCKFLESYIRSHHLIDNIDFIGPQSSEQYAAHMQGSELFITASAIENHCSTLREAMSVGVPCISSAVGGIIAYAIDHKNCSLFPYNHPDQLASAICELFDNRELREHYSNAGKKCIADMYTDFPKLSLPEIYYDLVQGKQSNKGKEEE